jgi:hypothetical protein
MITTARNMLASFCYIFQSRFSGNNSGSNGHTMQRNVIIHEADYGSYCNVILIFSVMRTRIQQINLTVMAKKNTMKLVTYRGMKIDTISKEFFISGHKYNINVPLLKQSKTLIHNLYNRDNTLYNIKFTPYKYINNSQTFFGRTPGIWMAIFSMSPRVV